MEEVFILFNKCVLNHFNTLNQGKAVLVDNLINSHFLKKGDKNGRRVDGFNVVAFIYKQTPKIANINFGTSQLVFVEEKYRPCFFDILENDNDPRCIIVKAVKTGQKINNKKVYHMNRLVVVENVELTAVVS